jgi:hypothetical protein
MYKANDGFVEGMSMGDVPWIMGHETWNMDHGTGCERLEIGD